ncbi:inositol 2-dehydrogenase [Vallitalea okinawensis]|uniref:inositol 2-dehydrogenase n=1 Tax=Vallitalea okinawensis TaxID=2078660 RepID=UPI000CFABAB9|nr:inositol 2-dehydrogenase [Vallitalea okinawensis]
MKLGLIGAGRIGKLHGEIITYHVPQATIKTVSDVYTDGLEEWAQSLGIEKVTKDYREILDDSEIEGVIIASSTDTHADLIIESAKAKKHIFCEKPVDFNVEKIKEALDTVKQNGIKLQIGFNRRFDHNFSRVRELVDQKKVGDVHIVKITSRDPAPPPVEYIKVSGGLFLDMTIHDFDMARFLSGSEVEEVFAYGTNLVSDEIAAAGDIDTAIINLKFKNGALGVIDNSREAVYGYDQRVEVFGNKGVVTVDNDFPNSAVLSSADAVVSEKPQWFFLERYKMSYVDELNEFASALLEDREPSVVGNDGLQPVYIALAAKESLETGAPVKTSKFMK